MIKKISLGLAVAAALTGCGGSSGGSSGGSKNFNIADYTPVANSTSITGTWVFVANGQEKDVYTDYWEEGSFSSKNVVIIKSSSSGYSMSSCYSGFNSLTVNNDQVVLPVGSSSYTVENNNKISGSVTNTGSNGEYLRATFDMVKISDSTSAFGTVNTTWSGSSNSDDSNEGIIAFCATSVNEIDNEGDRSVYSEYEFGVEPYALGTEIIKGHWYGESVEDLYVSGNSDTISENSYWGDTVSINYTETTSSFTGDFSATTTQGKSVQVSVNIQLP